MLGLFLRGGKSILYFKSFIQSFNLFVTGFITHTIPELTYAVIKCTMPSLFEAWNFASDWIAKNGYKDISYHYGEYEVYPENFKNEETDPMYIYVPVIKK